MFHKLIHFILLIIIAWCVMCLSHECGHLLGGWLSGAMVTEYDIAPWRLPYSFYDPNPHPLFTLWMGPIFGSALPFISLISHKLRNLIWPWFIANFCLLANGLYLMISFFSDHKLLDTHRLIDAGAHPVFIILFSVPAIAFGYVGFRKNCANYWQSKEETPGE